MIDEQKIFGITRPSPKLLTHYILQCCYLPPITFIGFPFLFFRYQTMKYEFDDEGISMSWGVLFRKQINLTYARIQDIHLTRGVVQRYLGLADLHIQTASGSAEAEMKIEGILEFEELRDFLYTRMRGYSGGAKKKSTGQVSPSLPMPESSSASETELVAAMKGVQEELKASRQLLEQVLAQRSSAPGMPPPTDQAPSPPNPPGLVNDPNQNPGEPY